MHCRDLGRELLTHPVICGSQRHRHLDHILPLLLSSSLYLPGEAPFIFNMESLELPRDERTPLRVVISAIRCHDPCRCGSTETLGAHLPHMVVARA